MKTAALAATLLAVLVGGTAHAVGDPPRRLSAREAATLYRSVRPLLVNDGIACPAGQRPVSATVSGGSAPGTGSSATSIRFDRGATVVVKRTWDAAAHSAAVSIACS